MEIVGTYAVQKPCGLGRLVRRHAGELPSELATWAQRGSRTVRFAESTSTCVMGPRPFRRVSSTLIGPCWSKIPKDHLLLYDFLGDHVLGYHESTLATCTCTTILGQLCPIPTVSKTVPSIKTDSCAFVRRNYPCACHHHPLKFRLLQPSD